MKIIRLHIENFGCYNSSDKKCDFDFNDNLNSFFLENGQGKTTLTYFIKGMFYGLSTKKSKNSVKEYDKYLPWNKKSPYGGYIEFEYNNKTYRLIRTFDSKSNDDIKVLDLQTNSTSSQFKRLDVIGEELFGINEEGFIRSVFVSNTDIGVDITDDLRAKITALTSGIDDANDVNDALVKLHEEILKVETTKGKDLSNKTQKINDDKLKLKNLKNELTDVSESLKSIEELQKEISLNEEEIAKLQQKQKDIASIESKKSMLKQKATFEENIKNYQAEVNEAKLKLNGHQDIDEKEISANLQNSYQINQLSNNLSTKKSLSNDEFNRLNDVFKETPLSDEKLGEIKSKLDEYSSAVVAPSMPVSKTKPTGKIVGMSISAVLLIVGIVLAFAVNVIVGVVLSMVGFVGLIVFLILFMFNKMAKAVNSQAPSVDKEKVGQELFKLLKPYGFDDFSYANNYDKLVRMNEKYKALIESELENKKQIDDYQLKLDNLTKELKAFLKLFNLPGEDYDNELKMIKDNLTSYNRAVSRLEDSQRSYNKFLLDFNFNDQTELVVELDNDQIIAKTNEYHLKNNELNSKISDIKSILVKQEEYENQIEFLTDEINSLTKEVETMNNRREHLKLVEKLLKESKVKNELELVKPMSDAMNKYSSLISKKIPLNIKVSSDMDISIEEQNGELKESFYYSRGYQELINLSLRFALNDILITDTKSFIVLDDPFVNLDDDKLKNAKDLLNVLCQEHQILYFTCHSSRKLD